MNNSYLNGYRKTLQILIGAIAVMLVFSFLMKCKAKTEAEEKV